MRKYNHYKGITTEEIKQIWMGFENISIKEYLQNKYPGENLVTIYKLERESFAKYGASRELHRRSIKEGYEYFETYINSYGLQGYLFSKWFLQVNDDMDTSWGEIETMVRNEQSEKTQGTFKKICKLIGVNLYLYNIKRELKHKFSI